MPLGKLITDGCPVMFTGYSHVTCHAVIFPVRLEGILIFACGSLSVCVVSSRNLMKANPLDSGK